ncbi:MAG: HAD-IIA family hydrolase [Melioribacteraceae bacterium]
MSSLKLYFVNEQNRKLFKRNTMIDKPLLIDLDGVLRIGNIPAEGVQKFLDFIRNNNIDACVLSNSSLYSSDEIRDFFSQHNIKIDLPIITAIDAGYKYVNKKYKQVAVYCDENVKCIFNEILNYKNPEAVLIGDIGNAWNYKTLQQIFEFVQNGAELITIHKNKYWNKLGEGIKLDAGPFVHAIEYATSVKATLIGKPSELYFRSALSLLTNNEVKESKHFIMLGDDLESDIKGANKLGAESILILTGKTKPPIPENYKQFVNYTANNLDEVIKILKNS